MARELKKQPLESDKAFAAFTEYVNLGPGRSLKAVAANLGKGPALIRTWSLRHDWAARLAQLTSQPSASPCSAPSTLNPQPPSTLPFQPALDEPHKALECFLCYFDLGVNRTYVRVATSTAVPLSTVKMWAARYNWRGRVHAYNTHLLQTRMTVETDARRDQAQVWADRSAAFKELEWRAAQDLLAAARVHLDAILAAEPGKVSLTDVARTLEIASKIGRLATGLSTDKQEITGPDGGPIRLEFEAALRKIYGPVVDVSTNPAEPELPTDTALPDKVRPGQNPVQPADVPSSISLSAFGGEGRGEVALCLAVPPALSSQPSTP